MSSEGTALRRPLSAPPAMMRDTLQCSPDCVKIVSESGAVEFFNDNGLCLMEIDDSTTVVGVQWASLWPEDQRSSLNHAFNQAKSTGIGAFQGFCPTAKGAPRWWDVVISGLPREPDGTQRFIVTSRDITRKVELEQAQQQLNHRLNEIFRAGADVLWDIDLVNDRVWWGEGMQSTFGYGPEQVGTSTQWCHEHMHPEDRQRVVKGMSDAIANGDMHWQDQFRYRKSDGTYLDVMDRGSVIRDSNGNAVRFIGIMQDNTARKANEQHDRALSQELAHRMNNMIAVITGLFTMTARKSSSMDELVDAFSSRLLAMANATTVLIRARNEGADLQELATTQLRPFSMDGRVSLHGPRVLLNLQVAQGIALALNELATNAIKYGALKSEGGAVAVTWGYASLGDRGLQIQWKESGGDGVTTIPHRKGLGSKLIEHGIPGARVVREFSPSGLVCTIELRQTDILSADS